MPPRPSPAPSSWCTWPTCRRSWGGPFTSARVDGKNLNRVYPGRLDGTVSERIAYAITHHVIEKADYVLDLHCGDANEWLRPYVYQTVTGRPEIDSAVAGLALAFGIDHILVDRGRPTDPARSLYCSNTAITRGKPALTVESGYLGTSDPKAIVRLLPGFTACCSI